MTTAMITVYHPSEDIRHNVCSVAEQADIVYICDNSPSSNRELFAGAAENIRYVCFGENLGVSRAFNRILKDPRITWQEDDYVLFFDQDSSIQPDHISRMIAVFESLQTTGFAVGCLGPAYFNTSSGHIEIPRAKKAISPDTYAVSSIITSSMLTTYGNLREAGFWNEDVFLDMADWDLCWRLTAGGKLCCLTEAVVLHHSVGHGEKKVGPLRLRVGYPYREYYQIRECLYLFGKKYTPLKYRIRFLAMLLIRSPLHVIFLDHRKERLKFIAKGFADFFRKKKGALDSHTINTEQLLME